MSALRDALDERSMPEPNSGCQLWLRCTRGYGYGAMQWDGRVTDVHRLSWMEANGPIPAGKVVCHRCDVPSCINPAHLFLDTQAGNLADMRAKGRRVLPPLLKGERNGGAKLTASAVVAIRADGRLHAEIAAEYGVVPGTITKIKRRTRWGHV